MTDQHEIDMSKSCNSARKYEFFSMISQYANPVLVTCKHLQCPDRTEIVKKNSRPFQTSCGFKNCLIFN